MPQAPESSTYISAADASPVVLLAALVAGAAFGARHALEADHVAAVAALVEEGRAAPTGAAWGLGHSLPVVVLGAAFVALGLDPPPVVGRAFEALAGVVLVVLGARVVIGRESTGRLLVRHLHGDGDHRHLRIVGRAVGLGHSHAAGESFAVGVVHGLAGGGGVVVVLAATAPTALDGTGFLAGFAVATVATMVLATWGWGRLVGRASRLRVLAGAASVVVGAALFATAAGVSLPV